MNCRTSHSEAGRKSRRPRSEPEPEVDTETFAECKELMRPVMKKIIVFGDYTDPGKSSQVQVSAMETLTWSSTHTSLSSSSQSPRDVWSILATTLRDSWWTCPMKKSGPGGSICGFTFPTSLNSPARTSTRCIKLIALKTVTTDRPTENWLCWKSWKFCFKCWSYIWHFVSDIARS